MLDSDKSAISTLVIIANAPLLESLSTTIFYVNIRNKYKQNLLRIYTYLTSFYFRFLLNSEIITDTIQDTSIAEYTIAVSSSVSAEARANCSILFFY